MTQNLPALPPKISKIVEEYDTKVNNIPALVKEYNEFYTYLDSQTSVQGNYVGRVYNHHPSIYEYSIKSNLLKSAWKCVYNLLGVERIMSASDRKKFEFAMESNLPEFTAENVRNTFGEYFMDPKFHVLKGITEAFTRLDPVYKSHQKVKVGVEGLPKRIIINSVRREYCYSTFGSETILDAINGIFTLNQEPLMEKKEIDDWIKESVSKKSYRRGFYMRTFGNGNGHLFFEPKRLDQINRALAEFYGDVLPDTPEENPKKKQSTELAKDLQFYPTPRKVCEKIVSDIWIKDGHKVLEPSCGEGALMQAIFEENKNIDLVGIEWDSTRAQTARDKGFKVVRANFLEVEPTGDFDTVIMNPPFYGLHWKKHIEHARKFIHDKGRVICVLPASAKIDGHLDDIGWHNWHDLPISSFKESGTNVMTGYVITDKG